MKTDGRLNELYQKWFGVDAPKGVIDGTNTPK
jgi:ABC-type amino acid transport substrate-binding protein